MNEIQARLKAFSERSASQPEQAKAIAAEALVYLQTALGLPARTLRRIGALEYVADTALTSVRNLSALAVTARFPAAAGLAHAIVRDLAEAADIARRADRHMESIDDTGKGYFLTHPQLIDADAVHALHASISHAGSEDGAKGERVKRVNAMLDATNAQMRAKVPDHVHASLNYTVDTVCGLGALQRRVQEVITFVGGEFAIHDNANTARALRLFSAELRAVSLDAETLMAAGMDEDAVFHLSPAGVIASQVMDEGLAHVLLHGSIETFSPSTRLRQRMEDGSLAPETAAQVGAFLQAMDTAVEQHVGSAP